MARLQIKRQIHQMDLTPRSPTKPLRITLPPFTAIFLLDNPTGELLRTVDTPQRQNEKTRSRTLVMIWLSKMTFLLSVDFPAEKHFFVENFYVYLTGSIVLPKFSFLAWYPCLGKFSLISLERISLKN